MVQYHSDLASSHVDLGEDSIKDDDGTSNTAVVGDLAHDDVPDPMEGEIVPDTKEKKHDHGTNVRGEEPDASMWLASPSGDTTH